MTVSHESSGCLVQPTIFRNTFLWQTPILSMLHFEMGNTCNPNSTDGVTTGSDGFNRSLIETFLFKSVLEFWPNLCQPHWSRCAISIILRFPKTPDKYRPRYLCLPFSSIIPIWASPTEINCSSPIWFVSIFFYTHLKRFITTSLLNCVKQAVPI